MEEEQMNKLTDEALSKATGGFNMVIGANIEKGECFESGGCIFVYEGETVYLPATEKVTMDLYMKDQFLSNVYNYSGTVPMQVGGMIGYKSLGDKSSIPYILRKGW